jgi:hypothetical protein
MRCSSISTWRAVAVLRASASLRASAWNPIAQRSLDGIPLRRELSMESHCASTSRYNPIAQRSPRGITLPSTARPPCFATSVANCNSCAVSQRTVRCASPCHHVVRWPPSMHHAASGTSRPHDPITMSVNASFPVRETSATERDGRLARLVVSTSATCTIALQTAAHEGEWRRTRTGTFVVSSCSAFMVFRHTVFITSHPVA